MKILMGLLIIMSLAATSYAEEVTILKEICTSTIVQANANDSTSATDAIVSVNYIFSSGQKTSVEFSRKHVGHTDWQTDKDLSRWSSDQVALCSGAIDHDEVMYRNCLASQVVLAGAGYEKSMKIAQEKCKSK